MEEGLFFQNYLEARYLKDFEATHFLAKSLYIHILQMLLDKHKFETILV